MTPIRPRGREERTYSFDELDGICELALGDLDESAEDVGLDGGLFGSNSETVTLLRGRDLLRVQLEGNLLPNRDVDLEGVHPALEVGRVDLLLLELSGEGVGARAAGSMDRWRLGREVLMGP